MTAPESARCARCGSDGYLVLANADHGEYWSHYRPQKEPHAFVPPKEGKA